MSSSFVFCFVLLGCSLGFTASELFDGHDIIGPCIDNACPLQYECRSDLCTFVYNNKNDDFTLTPTGVPASTAANVESSASPTDFPLLSSETFINDASSVISSTAPSSQKPSVPLSATTFSDETALPTATYDFPSSDSTTIPSQNPLSLSTFSPSTTTKPMFDFGSPCFFGPCSRGYECKNFWCIRSSSTLLPTRTASTQNPSSSSARITTEDPLKITGPCIGNLCPDDGSACKNGFCVKSSSAPGTCKDKRFGCALVSYLCNIFTDIMTEDCAYTCKKC